MIADWFVWTTAVWALIFGWSGARVVWHLMSRAEHDMSRS